MHQVPLNTQDISQAFLNIENKERSNPLPWNGQFSPQLIEVLLKTYASKDFVVLDPFAGSGTLLHEAGKRDLAAVGADINPAAYYLARMHTVANRTVAQRECLISSLDDSLFDLIQSGLPLFGSRTAYSADDRREKLRRIREVIDHSDSAPVFDVLLILTDFVKDAHDGKELASVWKRLKGIVRELPYARHPLRAVNCDARRLPLSDGEIDLVITSPPYINVFNYHQNYRMSTEAFGWDLLSVAKSEIGSNRKNRGNRFLTVIQYCLDLAQVFAELTRVSKKNTRTIFVVGRESRVLGVPFYNGEIISSIATKAANYELVTRQERMFKNRFGQSIYEDILHFVPGDRGNQVPFDVAREIARDCLHVGLESVAKERIPDLQDAIDRLFDVQPSPIYDPEAARKTFENAKARGAAK